MVEHHSFPKLRLVLRLLGPVTGSPERLMMSEKLPLIMAMGAAGKFAGMVVPELTKRGASVRGFVRSPDEINAPKAAGATETVIGDLEGVVTEVHYVAAKAGVLGFSRSLARVIGKDGITVNLIAPGLTLTPAVRAHMPAEMAEMVEAQVKSRAIPRDEVGDDLVGAVFFLTSPDADFMSGQTLNVDGGKHML
jgi:NAD(P)-dependent dehydrogenase (short-subunit alcohol dehydrogenase family)